MKTIFREFSEALASDSLYKLRLAWTTLFVAIVPAALLLSFGLSERVVLPALLILIIPLQFGIYVLDRSAASHTIKASGGQTSNSEPGHKEDEGCSDEASPRLDPPARLNWGMFQTASYIEVLPRERHSLPPLMANDAATLALFRKAASRLREQRTELLVLAGESGTGKSALAKALHSVTSRTSESAIMWILADRVPTLNAHAHFMKLLSHAYEQQQSNVTAVATIVLDEMESELLATSLGSIRDWLGLFHGTVIVSVTPNEAGLLSVDPKHTSRYLTYVEPTPDQLWRISLPTLRQRKDEIPLICGRFFGKGSRSTSQLDIEITELLENYSWPGNIRQLSSVLLWMHHSSHGLEIEREHVPAALRNPGARNFWLSYYDWISVCKSSVLEVAMSCLEYNESESRVAAAERYSEVVANKIAELAMLLSEDEVVQAASYSAPSGRVGSILQNQGMIFKAVRGMMNILSIPPFEEWASGVRMAWTLPRLP